MMNITDIMGLMIISAQVVLGQPKLSPVACNHLLKLIPNDTILYLNIPERQDDAVTGSEFARRIEGLSPEEREKAIAEAVLTGNVPSFSRKLRPVTVHQKMAGRDYELTFYAVCDYMAIGSDEDYLYVPVTPAAAQYLADRLKCSLPTKKMTDIIYRCAEIKLDPRPIPPSDEMTTVAVFEQHTDSIKRQISQKGFDRSADHIIAGHKKDIIISNKICSNDRDFDRVVIYGWHLSERHPIQPVYNGHSADYADYSHGVRLVAEIAFVNGHAIRIDEVLKDPVLSALLSDEGVIDKPRYRESDL